MVNFGLASIFYEARLEREEEWDKVLETKSKKCDREFWSDFNLNKAIDNYRFSFTFPRKFSRGNLFCILIL